LLLLGVEPKLGSSLSHGHELNIEYNNKKKSQQKSDYRPTL
jgi:hypothetical protein